MDDDDDVPPLEATRRKPDAKQEEGINGKRGEKSERTVDPTDGADGQEAVEERNEVAEAMMQRALAAREQKRKETDESRRKVDGFGGGLKKGFLSSKPQAIKAKDREKDKQPKDVKETQEVPFIAGAGSKEDAKRMSLQMPEVQQAMQGVEKLKQDQSWVTPQLMAALQSRPELLKSLSDPKIQEAMQLMQTDPDEARRRYSDNEEVSKFIKDFGSLMATHFNVLSKEASNTPSGYSPKEQIAKSPKNAQNAQKAQNAQALPTDDPKVAAAFQDPEVQQLLSELYAGKPLEMHELCQQRPHLFHKVKILLDSGLLALQR
ncbi:unnamed protein product [Cladocopium goreaui]|uniref:Phosphatidylinositol 3-kinase n=1 Tax=Cladocopium goreaui TaxID=2562237 RepID=A0A9P1C837_9DINO|nr:unnamed protein product [Cladocopium goreaui]